MILNETVNNILSRRTVREYTEEPVSDEALETLIECGKFAPSARNCQPCKVKILSSKKFLDDMNSDFKDVVGWDTPAYTNWDKNPFYQNAPTVMFIFSKGDNQMEAGLMAENIAIAAKSIGLDTCIIASVGALFHAPAGEKWRRILGADEDHRFLVAVAVGHGCESPQPKERKAEMFTILKTED